MRNCNQIDCRKKNPQTDDQFTFYGHCNGAVRGQCKSCQAEIKAVYYKTNAEMFRGKLLVKKYWPHLSWQDALKEYDRLLSAQNGVCKICKKPETGVHSYKTNEPKMLAVDHKHGTLIVRGLLCHKCNRAIGLLQDSPELCYATGNYLSETNPQIQESNVIPFRKASQ